MGGDGGRRQQVPAAAEHQAGSQSSPDDVVAAVRSMPGEASRQGLHALAGDLLVGGVLDACDQPLPVDAPDEQAAASGSALGRIVDVFVGAQRLGNWALWLQLAAAAHLIAQWQSSPPIVQGAFDAPEPTDPRCQGLAERLWRLVDEIEVWIPVDTHDLAESFVASELAAAGGLTHYKVGQVVDAARALFMTTRLPRTRQLLRAGLLDRTKVWTIVSATQDLDDEVCALVEAAVIPDADLVVAEPLDVLADPAHPGAPLPEIARMNNPTLLAKLHAAIAAIDAEAAARRGAKARADRAVWGRPLPDGMGKLELHTGHEQIAAILTGLDEAAAAAKASGDRRRMDQIRCDHAVHLLTDGAFGAGAYPPGTDEDGESRSSDRAGELRDGCDDNAAADGNDDVDGVADDRAGTDHPGRHPDERVSGQGKGQRKRRRKGRRRRGLQVRLAVPLSTWLDLADDPAVLDGYGPIPATIARQIAADALRDHPATTTWRCVVVDDRHRTVLGVGDLIPTPRHDPTQRQAAFARSAEPFCVFPGCRVQAWRCDLDHRIPYDPDNPRAGGPTCTCNIQPLCRRHHRLRTAGLVVPHNKDGGVHAHAPGSTGDASGSSSLPDVQALADAEVPPGTIVWTTFTGRSYEHRPPAATPDPASREAVALAAAADARRRNEAGGTPMDDIYDENTALGQWDRSRRLERERSERRAGRHRPTRTFDPVLPQEPPF